MASSGNFAVFSTVTRPESPYSSSDQITGGGLSIKGPSSGSFEPCIASISPSSGKWYWEYRAGQGGGSSYGRPAIGTSKQTVVKNEDYAGGGSGQTGVLFTVNDGGKRINGSDSSYGNAVSQHDIVQIALDCDNGAVYLGINNTWQNSGDPTSGSSKTGAALTSGIQNVGIDIIHTRYAGGGIDQYNFGQDDTFGGAITAAGNADGNGHGVFKYSPPSGYLALCSANLPISDDIDPAQTDSDYPAKQFNVVTYTGTGSDGNNITGLGFQPDLVWFKNRSNGGGAYKNNLADTNRGVTKVLYSDSNSAEETNGDITSFDSDGFTVGGSGTYVNASSQNYVAWAWRANGGTTATNNDGSTTSTVQANTKAGFSIITYAGNGSNRTIGHGLSSAPDFMIFKNRDASSNWVTYARSQGAGNRGQINTTNAWGASSTSFQSTDPTSSVISLGTSSGTNASGNDFVCYAWHNVEGMQRFGSYRGNGNVDGPFIYTGFRPKLLVQKRVDGTGSWRVWDSARHTFNPNDAILRWEDSGAEDTANASVSFLSNGFKIRITYTEVNADGGDYVYMCWGDVPFRYNNTF